MSFWGAGGYFRTSRDWGVYFRTSRDGRVFQDVEGREGIFQDVEGLDLEDISGTPRDWSIFFQ